MRTPIKEGTSRPTIYRVPVKNTTSETIPPHGIMQIVSASEVLVEDAEYRVTKPNGAAKAKYLINGPTEIIANREGFGTNDYPSDAAYNASSGTATPGSEWGPLAGSWLLSFSSDPNTAKGYLILGGAHSGDPSLVRVAPLTTSTTSESIKRKIAIVTTAAGQSTYTFNGVTGGTIGRCALLNEDMQKVSGASTDEIEFKSLHFTGVPTEAMIDLVADKEIVLGSTWDGRNDTPLVKVWGIIIAAPYELAELTGFGPITTLAVPETGSTPQDIQWLGAECQEESGSG